VLVRHGHAAAGWDRDLDPGLDDAGHAQARAMADAVAPTGPLPIVASPLRRTRETAAPLEARWSATARIEPWVGEIPSPTDDLHERGQWLRGVMAQRWSDLDPSVHDWRAAVLAALRAIPGDAVVVTHFIAINIAVGLATGDDRVVCSAPGYCSRTTIDVDPASGEITVVERGEQADTMVG
jgi:broad specificity phosphatase PhoE